MKIVINEGTSFFISNEFGDSYGKESGLYYNDTRFLSNYKLSIDGCKTAILNSERVDHYSALTYLTNQNSNTIPKDTITIKRSKFVGRGLHEDIDISNHHNKVVEFNLVLEFGADFADIFEVKQQRVKKREVEHVLEKKKNSLKYFYEVTNFLRQTVIKFNKCDSQPKLEPNKAVFKVRIKPKQTWHTCLDVCLSVTKQVRKPLYGCRAYGVFKPEIDEEVADYLRKAPYLETDFHIMERAFGRAKRDLAALSLRVSTDRNSVLVTAAGIPWFVTLFGRDSIIAGLQSMLLTPKFARGSLLALASRQGRNINDFNAERPGAILHEVRFGELAVTREVPHALYYATIDATPLFLLLIGEYFKWTADLKLIRHLEPNIKAALKWIDEYGDFDGDGYVEYPDKSISWKDSFDSISWHNGKLAKAPVAVCEVQGYVYAAKMAIADIYQHLGKEEKALKLRKEAQNLKKNFNKDFWMEDKQFYALGLDKDKKKIDSITSNPGHLLFSGILTKERAKKVVDRLMKDDMFSGWGIRTLSEKSGAYNPISYHNGSVWPHDNAIIAYGFKKYGFVREANTIIKALVEASQHFEAKRLPELFCGYARKGFSFPVIYPVSSSPQAWG
ncbi:MAG: amylo-alpha-1,6-glucosidase, partial [Actinobacteria bacterium]